MAYWDRKICGHPTKDGFCQREHSSYTDYCWQHRKPILIEDINKKGNLEVPADPTALSFFAITFVIAGLFFIWLEYPLCQILGCCYCFLSLGPILSLIERNSIIASN